MGLWFLHGESHPFPVPSPPLDLVLKHARTCWICGMPTVSPALIPSAAQSCGCSVPEGVCGCGWAPGSLSWRGTAHGRAGAGRSLVSFPTRPFCDSCLQHALQEQKEKEGSEPFNRRVTVHKRAKKAAKVLQSSVAVCVSRKHTWRWMRAALHHPIVQICPRHTARLLTVAHR